MAIPEDGYAALNTDEKLPESEGQEGSPEGGQAKPAKAVDPSGTRSPGLYELYAVLSHRGDATSGHYHAYIRADHDGAEGLGR